MSSEHGLIDEEKLVSSDATLAFNTKQDYHSGECVLCDKTFEGMTNEEVSRCSCVRSMVGTLYLAAIFLNLSFLGASDALMIHRWFFDLQVTEHYSFEHQLHDLFYNEPETMLERAKSDEFGPRESRHASIQQTLHSRSDNQGSHSMHFCQK